MMDDSEDPDPGQGLLADFMWQKKTPARASRHRAWRVGKQLGLVGKVYKFGRGPTRAVRCGLWAVGVGALSPLCLAFASLALALSFGLGAWRAWVVRLRVEG
jgi:hypothetical protein